MIKNFLLVAIRVFFRQRVQSLLNVAGLAIGLACAMFVFLYVHDELTYDTQHSLSVFIL
jgi:putative ABC transport system permease protein